MANKQEGEWSSSSSELQLNVSSHWVRFYTEDWGATPTRQSGLWSSADFDPVDKSSLKQGPGVCLSACKLSQVLRVPLQNWVSVYQYGWKAFRYSGEQPVLLGFLSSLKSRLHTNFLLWSSVPLQTEISKSQGSFCLQWTAVQFSNGTFFPAKYSKGNAIWKTAIPGHNATWHNIGWCLQCNYCRSI